MNSVLLKFLKEERSQPILWGQQYSDTKARWNNERALKGQSISLMNEKVINSVIQTVKHPMGCVPLQMHLQLKGSFSKETWTWQIHEAKMRSYWVKSNDW